MAKKTFVLSMTFADAENRTRTIRVPNPDPELTGEKVEDVMDFFESTEIFESWSYPVRKKSAKMVETTTNELEITVS